MEKMGQYRGARGPEVSTPRSVENFGAIFGDVKRSNWGVQGCNCARFLGVEVGVSCRVGATVCTDPDRADFLGLMSGLNWLLV